MCHHCSLLPRLFTHATTAHSWHNCSHIPRLLTHHLLHHDFCELTSVYNFFTLKLLVFTPSDLNAVSEFVATPPQRFLTITCGNGIVFGISLLIARMSSYLLIALIGSRRDRGFLIPHTSVGTAQTANKARIHLNYLSRAHRSSPIPKSELALDGRFGYLKVPGEEAKYQYCLYLHCREGCQSLLKLFIKGSVPQPTAKSLAKLFQMFSTEHAVCTALPYSHCVTILTFFCVFKHRYTWYGATRNTS